MGFQLQYIGTFLRDFCFAEIICITRPDTVVSRKTSTWSKDKKDGNKIKLE